MKEGREWGGGSVGQSYFSRDGGGDYISNTFGVGL